jgi:hypothetical protein
MRSLNFVWKALKWVQDAKEPELGAYLWGEEESEHKIGDSSRDSWFNYVRSKE